MSYRPKFWMAVSLAMFAAAAWFWHLGEQRRHAPRPSAPAVAPQPQPSAADPLPAPAPVATTPAPAAPATASATAPADDRAPQFPNRLSNTTRPLRELMASDSAILLQNALIETGGAPAPRVPEKLRANRGHGSYIVQASGPVTPQFRRLLDQVGAEIVAYIPNNAYLVRMDDVHAGRLPRLAEVRAVLPYEPYYKFEMGLLDEVIAGALPGQAGLFKVLAFPGEEGPVTAALAATGAQVLGTERNPFGRVLMISLPQDRAGELALISGVQRVERMRDRALANDLARVRVRLSPDTVTPLPAGSHLGLDGAGIRININDSGVDPHPDLAGRILNVPPPPADTVGHGTHVAGIIAGDGSMSAAVTGTNLPGSFLPPVSGQFRGMAPASELFWQPVDLTLGAFFTGDELIQQGAARTNALVSNNSWGYVASYGYDLAAASYDVAVRDSLPGDTGDQPVLFVFAAGNFGNGSVNGTGGSLDSVNSPGTAKNVITVGALEQNRRFDTNYSFCVNGVLFTNSYFDETDSASQVAFYSGRGNVDPGVEGVFGRLKPDLVAPGSFVFSLETTNRVINTNNISTLTRSVNAQFLQPGATNFYTFDFPVSGTMVVFLTPNQASPVPFPVLDIFVDTNTPPVYPALPTGTNFVVVPVPAGRTYIAIENNNAQPVAYDATLIGLLDNCGDAASVLEQLNLLADPTRTYRFNTGTSMAAPVVSGLAALVQQFLATQGMTNPSPALIKAMLINGARSAQPGYTFNVDSFNPTLQGWGVPDITNSLPFTGTNAGALAASQLVRIFDQNVTNALATGESHTFDVALGAASTNGILRATLVWTDPPGNPGASIKLVNNLDLIVTNLDSGEVFVGNNFESGIETVAIPGSVAATNTALGDFVNNVENVIVGLPGGTNFSVTVRARRVNVQARDDFFSATGFTNDVVQDYALVISVDPFSGSSLNVGPLVAATNLPPVATPFALTTNGLPLFGQRAGANPVLHSALNTNGVPQQWVFYEVTNNVPNGSNVVFATFFPPNLSRSRVRDADVDLFVSMDPGLTNLSPAVLDSPATLRSIRRGGSEFVTLSNSVAGDVFYVGVKAEDQQGAEFGFFAAASALPFSQRDAEGNLIVNFLPVPAPIPDGEASAPQGALLVGVAIDDGLPGQVQRLVATNVITHDDVGDLQAVLAGPPDDLGDIRQVVLRANNYFPDELALTSFVVYDDSEENDPPPAAPFVATETVGQAAGIGGLQGFVGQSGFGLWQLTVIDNIPVFQGTVDSMILRIEPSNTNDLGNNLTLAGDGSFLDVVNVPVGATNFSVAVVVNTPGQFVDVQIRRGQPPVRGNFAVDKGATFGPGITLGDTLSVTLLDNPPLNPGPYYVLFSNPDPVNPVNITYRYIVDIAPTPGTPLVFTNASGPVTLLDDALTNSIITVTNAGRISDVSVGVRIDHDRVSDLVLHLRSPQGTRVLLSENRGGPTGTNYGGPGPTITNLIPVLASAFDTNAAMTYATAAALGPWTVVSNPVTVVDDAMVAHTTNRYLALTNGGVFQTLPTLNGTTYRVSFQYQNETNAVVDIAGVTNAVLTGAAGVWQEFTVDFTAAGPTAILIAGLDGDVWIDTFVLSEVQVIPTITHTFFTENTNFTSRVMKYAQAPFVDNQLAVATTNYFMPEESMTSLRGQVAAGDWNLEVWDNRLGAPLGTLLEWRLEIIFNNVGPTVTPLFNGDCVTNTVALGEVHYYAVQVPAAAMLGTNFLTSFTTGGLDLLFNQNFLPDGTQPGDFQLLTNAAVDQAVLATNSVPPLVPGSVYLLAVRNNNPAETNTYELCVRFDVASIFSSAFLTASAAPGQTLYYQFNIPASAATAQFDLVSLSGAAGLVISKSPNVPQEGNAHYSSVLTGANDKQVIVTSASMPVPLAAGVWNVGVVNKSGATLVHTVRATTFNAGGNPDGTQWRDAELAPGEAPAGGTPVTFNTVLGDDYRVEWSGTMTNWNTLTNFTATNVLTTVVDPTPVSTLNQRFYRLLRID